MITADKVPGSKLTEDIIHSNTPLLPESGHGNGPISNYGVAILLAFGILSFAHRGLYLGLRPGGGEADLRPCYIAAVMARHGDDFYDTQRARPYWETHLNWKEGDAWPFLYPAPSLILYLPLSFFPFEVASKIWVAVSLAALAGIWWVTGRCVGSLGKPGLTPILLAYLLALPGTGYTLALGQLNLLVLLLVVIAFWMLLLGRDLHAGLAIAGAALLKVAPAGLILYPLIRGRWRAVAGFVLGVAVSFAIAAIAFGPRQTLAIVSALAQHDIETTTNTFNQSLPGLVNAAASALGFQPNSRAVRVAGLACSGAVILITAGVLLLTRKDRTFCFLEYGLVAVASLLFAPKSLHHHFVIAYAAAAGVGVVWPLTGLPGWIRWATAIGVASLLIDYDFDRPGEGLPAIAQLVLAQPLTYAALFLWVALMAVVLTTRRLPK